MEFLLGAMEGEETAARKEALCARTGKTEGRDVGEKWRGALASCCWRYKKGGAAQGGMRAPLAWGRRRAWAPSMGAAAPCLQLCARWTEEKRAVRERKKEEERVAARGREW
jgi:hypothetical protein